MQKLTFWSVQIMSTHLIHIYFVRNVLLVRSFVQHKFKSQINKIKRMSWMGLVWRGWIRPNGIIFWVVIMVLSCCRFHLTMLQMDFFSTSLCHWRADSISNNKLFCWNLRMTMIKPDEYDHHEYEFYSIFLLYNRRFGLWSERQREREKNINSQITIKILKPKWIKLL